MEALIGRLDRRLATRRPESYARLRPGATDAQLDAIEARSANVRFYHDWEDRTAEAPGLEPRLAELVGAMEGGTLTIL